MIKESEEFVKILNRIASLKEAKKYNEVFDFINDVLLANFEISHERIRLMSVDDLVNLLRSEAGINEGKWAILGELLMEEADVYHLQNMPGKSYPRYIKALNIFLELSRLEKTTFTFAYHARIEDIFSRTIIFELPKETKLKLFQYFEDNSKYAAAEDILFNILESGPRDKSLINIGVAFYLRLLQKKDSELIKGKLPREEVAEGLARIKSL